MTYYKIKLIELELYYIKLLSINCIILHNNLLCYIYLYIFPEQIPLNACLINRFKILFAIFWIWFNGFGIWLPICRTYLTMLLNKLESFNQSQCLFDASANRKIIDAKLSKNSFLVYNEKTSKSNS